MMRAERHAAFDTEGLQADVMRFLAIIAFCLIAILALVEKLEPAPTDEVLPRIPEPMAQETEEVPTEHPQPVSPANIAQGSGRYLFCPASRISGAPDWRTGRGISQSGWFSGRHRKWGHYL